MCDRLLYFKCFGTLKFFCSLKIRRFCSNFLSCFCFLSFVDESILTYLSHFVTWQIAHIFDFIFVYFYFYKYIDNYGSYVAAITSTTIPITTSNGIAMYMNPASTSPISISGRKIRRKQIFVIPQVARKASPANFPNTPSIIIINNNVSIILSPLFLSMLSL